MDSLKTLLDKKNYDLIIKLTNSSSNGNDLFFRISAFISLGKYEDALFVIQDHKEALEKCSLYSLINIHINLLITLERYDQAYSALEYYSNLPYESQNVEELLRTLPEVISKSENNKTSTIRSEEEIIQNLNSNDPEEILFGLDSLKKYDINEFLPEISKILLKEGKQSVRSFALMLLLSKNVNKDFNYLSYKGIIKVNPSKINEPFKGEIFNSILRKLDKIANNVTLIESSAQLLSSLVIYTFPFEIKESVDEVVAAIYLHSKKLINDEDISIEEYSKINNLQISKVYELFDLIDLIQKEL